MGEKGERREGRRGEEEGGENRCCFVAFQPGRHKLYSMN